MKFLIQFYFIVLFSLFAQISAFTQGRGAIFSREANPVAGKKNRYIYTPPGMLNLPEKLIIKIAYRSNGNVFDIQELMLHKEASYFCFDLSLPESSCLFIASVFNEQNEVIDNNNGRGYCHFLYDKNGNRLHKYDIQRVSLVDGFASYFFELQYSDAEIIDAYESIFRVKGYREYKTDYYNYLSALYRDNRTGARAKLLLFAGKIKKNLNNESDLLIALNIYRLLQMENEKDVLMIRILQRFPRGETAKKEFWKKYYAYDEKNSDYIEFQLRNYILEFSDTSFKTRNKFYVELLKCYIKKHDYKNIIETETKITEADLIIETYKNEAWQLLSEIQDIGEDKLMIAKFILMRSLGLLEVSYSPNLHIEFEGHKYFQLKAGLLDAYAYCHYLGGEYDSAFIIQDQALNTNRLSVEGRGRFAMIAEKAKGEDFAIQFLEQQLKKGVIAEKYLISLFRLYKSSSAKGPESGNKQTDIINILSERRKKDIRQKLGSEQAVNFTLADLNGKLVSLEDFKNKIVVLDFWATWCVPCIASFSKMKSLIDKYESTGSVVFLFLNTFEYEKEPVIRMKVEEILRKKELNFNVLFDTKQFVANNYKVASIPVIYIINKQGNIIYIGSDLDSIQWEIESSMESLQFSDN